MKKIILSLLISLSSFAYVISNDALNRGVCAPCNPCVPSCLVAGSFQTSSSTYEQGQVIQQNGCLFVVNAIVDVTGALTGYRVTFLTPFCTPVATVASNTTGGVTVDAEDETGFTLGNVPFGDTVYFVSAPTQCK